MITTAVARDALVIGYALADVFDALTRNGSSPDDMGRTSVFQPLDIGEHPLQKRHQRIDLIA